MTTPTPETEREREPLQPVTAERIASDVSHMAGIGGTLMFRGPGHPDLSGKEFVVLKDSTEVRWKEAEKFLTGKGESGHAVYDREQIIREYPHKVDEWLGQAILGEFKDNYLNGVAAELGIPPDQRDRCRPMLEAMSDAYSDPTVS